MPTLAPKGGSAAGTGAGKPTLLVLTSTYPRWADDPEPGFVHELAKRLTDSFRVIVLGPHALHAKVVEVLDGVEVIRYRYAPERLETLVNDGGIVTNLRRSRWKYLLVPGFVLAQAWSAWRLIRANNVDVIHAHWLIPQGLVAALLKRLPGGSVPFVVTSHGSDVNLIQGGLLDSIKRWVIRSAGVVTAVSESLRVALAEIGGCEVDVRVQPMGVDLTGRFVPSDVPRHGREILFVGRLVPGKGADNLIRAMPGVLAREPEARLTVVGHGPEQVVLRTLAAEIGVSGSVSFVGPVAQEQLPRFYRRAGVFVAAFGQNEGFGLVLVEAIGCACPVIANDVASAHYILGDSFAQFSVDCDDIDGLADRIVAVLDDPVAAQVEVSRVRSYVNERFDWGCAADNYMDILQEVASHETKR